MKELEQHQSELTEVRAQVPVKTQKVVAQIKPHPGHSLYELDLSTRRITKVDVAYEDASYESFAKGDKTAKKGKVKMREGCLYASALNWKNADKKFFKMLGIKYPSK